MKKGHIILIAVAVVFVTTIFPFIFIFSGAFSSIDYRAEIEIDSYRLCENEDGDDIIIIKYLLKNTGKEPTALYYEGNFYAYQDGVGLNEYLEELPKECNYDLEDQYKNIKSGVEYYAEIAYLLESPDKDVEVEVDDYRLLFDEHKEKVFTIK